MNSLRIHLPVLSFSVCKLLTAFIGLSIGMHAGCSRPTATTLPSIASKPSEPSASQSPPARADEAVRRVLDGLQHRQARALWEFLPPSYRRDAQQLIRDVAERLDEKSWEPLVSTWQKARQALAKKLSALTPPKADVAERDPRTSAAFNPAALVQLLDAIGDSELSDLQRLRFIELDRFLDQTGDKLLAALGRIATGDTKDAAEDPFLRFGQVQVELISSSAETAIVQVRWPEQEPTTHPFVRVEDHWIPQSLAESWPSQFPEVRERGLAWADGVREQPDEWHTRLRDIEQLLDELDATKSDAEARQVWQSGVSRLMVAWLSSSSSDTKKSDARPDESLPSKKPARVKRPDTEVLLPDEAEK